MAVTTHTLRAAGDLAASDDLRAGADPRAAWSEADVLAHCEIACETDASAVAYGLAGDALVEAQREVLAGYRERMEAAR